MQLKSRRRLFLIVLGLLIIVGVGLILSRHHTKPASDESSGIYVDPLSHETVSNPAGKSPDVFGQPPSAPVYLGFDKLLDHGLTFGQLTTLKTAFYNYSLKQPHHLSEINIDVDHITSKYNPASGDPSFYILFNGTFDRQADYSAKVQYTGLNDVHLYLMDTSGKVIYDSGLMSTGE